MKRNVRFGGYPFRSVASSVLGQAADSVIATVGMFAGVLPLASLIGICVAEYCVKIAYEVLWMPFTWTMVRWYKAKFGVDAVDSGSNWALYKPY
jgi:uncharacterized PurR-regulated membrane protein YhhQ (DUF165 family)